MNVVLSRLLPLLLLRLPLALLVMAIGFVVTSIAGLLFGAFTRRVSRESRAGSRQRPVRTASYEPSGSDQARAGAPPAPVPQDDLPWDPEDVEDARFEEIQ